MIKRSLLLALVSMSLAACGSAPPRQPAAIEQAGKAELAAHRALRDGDLPRAGEMFRLAMLRQQALENLPAYAQAGINLASVQHRLGQDEAALALLHELLANRSGLMPRDLQTTAAFRKAVILADQEKYTDAGAALQNADQLCANACSLRAGINNLQARLALQAGDDLAALARAKQVIAAGPDKEELANALRIAGKVENKLQQHNEALTHYSSALELDKELAFSLRIAEDLQGIAVALQGLGRNDEAATFAKRAEAVSTAARALQSHAPGKTVP